jgi:phage terminase large subunit-like protein
VASGFLYDSLEAPPDTDMSVPDSLRAGLVAARGDSTWLDVDRLMEEILDPTTSPAMSRRFYLNQVVAAEDAWVAPHEWDACGIDGQAVRAKGIITLGFDGSKSDDTTALIGCRVEDGYLFEIGSWDPANYPSRDPDGVVRYEVPSAEIAGAVVKAFETYDVVGFLADVHPWESYIDAWEEAFGEGLCARATERRAIAFDMRQERAATLMVEQFHAAITEREARHGREPGLSEHIYNARRRPNRVGISFAKESRFSSRKIDRAAAAALAWKARSLYLLLPEEKRRQEAKVAGVWFA